MKLFLPVQSAQSIAQYFLSLVDEEAGDSISNLKLQKLLYYAQGFHLAFYDTPLFPEAIKKWAHGPVVPQIYHEYKDYGANAIPPVQIDLNDYTQNVRELLDEIYSVYGQFSALKLRSMTHNEPPWLKADDNEAISHESMKQFFKTLILDDDDPTKQTY
jgi:uncharacterized phage-associated protein